MKILILFSALVLLTGCYSILTVNLGSVNHAAETTGPKMPPEVQCAALVGEALKMGAIDAEEMQKICQNITAKEAKGSKKK